MRHRAATSPIPSGGLLFVYDLAAIALSALLSLLLRFETLDLAQAVAPFLPIALIPVFVRPAVGLTFGLYRREWRFASMRELWDIAASVATGTIAILLLYGAAAGLALPGTNPFPRSFFLIEPLLTFVLIGGGRFALRIGLERGAASPRRGVPPVKSLIYGAGDAGAAVARLAARDPGLGLRVVGYLDDDPRKRGSRLHGFKVMGGIGDLRNAVARSQAHQLVVAIPSRAGGPVRKALAEAEQIGLEVKTVPPIRDLITGEIQAARIRRLSVEDLLRREPISLDTDAIAGYLNGASVVVTGGGGSIGGELVRQILRIGPRVLTVLDYHEAALWSVERDAAVVVGNGSGTRLNAVLADIRSPGSMSRIIARAKPDVVFHAAALKHVPYVELHPSEGVLTNVIGTRNVLAASEAAGVPNFVLISTDKAVEPASVMGWTKRLAELLTIETGHRLCLAYSAVRFGNVLGSSGSIVPLLERQLEDRLPLTITEPNATRYFMTLGEAVTLILEAGAAASPGEVYVLDMGEPLRIGDLVRDLIRLKGMEEDEVEIVVTGLRPGEKLRESLFFTDERPEETAHQGIRRAVAEAAADGAHLAETVNLLETVALRRDDAGVREALKAWRSASVNGAFPSPTEPWDLPADAIRSPAYEAAGRSLETA